MRARHWRPAGCLVACARHGGGLRAAWLRARNTLMACGLLGGVRATRWWPAGCLVACARHDGGLRAAWLRTRNAVPEFTAKLSCGLRLPCVRQGVSLNLPPFEIHI